MFTALDYMCIYIYVIFDIYTNYMIYIYICFFYLVRYDVNFIES